MHLLPILLTLFLVSACTYNSEPMGKPLPDLSYSHLTPLSANGKSFTVIRNYLFNKQPDYFKEKARKNNFVMPLEVAIERYVTSRFKLNGPHPNAAVNIKKIDLSYESSIYMEDIYKAHVVLSFSKIGYSNSHNLTVRKTLSIPSNYSLAEREFAQFEFIESVIHEIDNAVNVIVPTKLSL